MWFLKVVSSANKQSKYLFLRTIIRLYDVVSGLWLNSFHWQTLFTARYVSVSTLGVVPSSWGRRKNCPSRVSALWLGLLRAWSTLQKIPQSWFIVPKCCRSEVKPVCTYLHTAYKNSPLKPFCMRGGDQNLNTSFKSFNCSLSYHEHSRTSFKTSKRDRKPHRNVQRCKGNSKASHWSSCHQQWLFSPNAAAAFLPFD